MCNAFRRINQFSEATWKLIQSILNDHMVFSLQTVLYTACYVFDHESHCAVRTISSTTVMLRSIHMEVKTGCEQEQVLSWTKFNRVGNSRARILQLGVRTQPEQQCKVVTLNLCMTSFYLLTSFINGTTTDNIFRQIAPNIEVIGGGVDRQWRTATRDL